MKSLKKGLVVVLVLGWACVVIVGCATTPAGETVIRPEAIDRIDAIAAVAEPLGVTLGILFPSAAALGGVLAGIAGTWRRMSPQVKEAETQADIATFAGESTAVAVEEFKTKFPEEWSNLSRILSEHHGLTAENFYRGLRGLPPKD